MSLEALIIFSLLNAGQLAENSKVDIHKEQKDAYVYVQKKRKINNFILYINFKSQSIGLAFCQVVGKRAYIFLF